MADDSLAQIQEETTLARIRVVLNSKGLKLWEPPYIAKGF